MQQESNWRESSRSRKSCQKSELAAGTDFSQNSTPYIALKLSRDPHAVFIFHCSRLTPTHWLLFIRQKTKYHLVVSWLPAEAAREVKRLRVSPPKEKSFTKLRDVGISAKEANSVSLWREIRCKHSDAVSEKILMFNRRGKPRGSSLS